LRDLLPVSHIGADKVINERNDLPRFRGRASAVLSGVALGGLLPCIWPIGQQLRESSFGLVRGTL